MLMNGNDTTLNYDSKCDAIYIAIKKGIEEEFREVASGINVELNKDGEVIGIEILHASRFFKPIVNQLYKQMQLTETEG